MKTGITEFDEWYELYPRKIKKLDAIKAWKQMTKEFAPQEIIDGLKSDLPRLLAREPQFRPYPASWLRGGEWMNEPEPPKQDPFYTEYERWSNSESEQRTSNPGDGEIIPPDDSHGWPAYYLRGSSTERH